jgi:hypothetical protein
MVSLRPQTFGFTVHNLNTISKVKVKVMIKVKVKFTLEQATKAHRGSRCITVLFL